MDVWGSGSNKQQAFIKKKTSFERMPEWQTNIIEETNLTKEGGGFDDNFSELSEMEVIFKSGLTDQEFKTVSVTAEEDDIWSSAGLFPERMFGQKKEKKRDIDEERDYVNIPVGKKKCNTKGLSVNNAIYQNDDPKLPPPIPRRNNKQSKVNWDHIYEEIPFEEESTTVLDKISDPSTEILNNDDIYELYGFDDVTHRNNKSPKSTTSEDVECLYAVVNKRAKTSSIDKHSTNQTAGNDYVANENQDSYYLVANRNRNSCNNIPYSVHLYSDLSSSIEMSQEKNSEIVSEKENHIVEENVYDLIPSDFNLKLNSESSSSDNSVADVCTQKETPKSNKIFLSPVANKSPAKKPKKVQAEGKHFNRSGPTKSKLSVWYVEDCIDAQPIKEIEKTSASSSKHYRKETDCKVSIETESMSNEESNIIILGAEVETSQCVPNHSISDNAPAVQPTGPHTNTLIDFDLMAASSNFSLKNHLRGEICKDDLVQQYCESLSEVLSSEDVGNEHITIEQGMKLSSTAESGLGSSDGDALSDRASCDGMDRASCDGMDRASCDEHDSKSNNCRNINLLEMEMSLTNTETSGYETPLSPLSPSSVDLNVGHHVDCQINGALNRHSLAKQNSQEEAEQRRLENDEKRKSFFGSDSSFEQSSTFEPKLSTTPATLPASSKSSSVGVLPKLNDSFPRQHQHTTYTSTPTDHLQRPRASTDSALLDESESKEIYTRDRSLTESEIEELKKAQAAAAERKSSKFMKQLYYGINTPDDENCEVDENGKPLYEYEYERRQLIGSMKMKKQKRASWINEENGSNLPASENELKDKKLFEVKKDTSCISNKNKCEIKNMDAKTSEPLEELKAKEILQPLEHKENEKQEDEVKPISVQERMELLNLDKECTNEFKNNKGKFNRTSVKKKETPAESNNDRKDEVEFVEKTKEKTNDENEKNVNKIKDTIPQIKVEADDNVKEEEDVEKICMKAARSMFESKISKLSSEGLKRRQTSPHGEGKSLSAFQTRLSLRKNDLENDEKMREKILADMTPDDMDVKIIEKNDANLMVTDFEDMVDNGDSYMSYDVTETSKQEEIKSETIVEREIRLQRERDDEFSRNGTSKLKKPTAQEKEKRQSVAEELEKEQEIIKAHETVIEREIREQKEREKVVLRERTRVMGERHDSSRDCSPSSADRAKPIVDDSSRIMIYGLGLGSNGMPEVRVQRFSGTEEQWSRIKTAPSSYKEYQKLLRGQASRDDANANQPQKVVEEPKQELTPTKKAGSLRAPSSPKSLAYIHKSTDDDSFSLDVVPDVIIRDKQVAEPKKRTPNRKESTIERDIRLAQQREEELYIQKRKTKELDVKPQNLTTTDGPVTQTKRPAAKTYSSSSTCSSSSSMSSSSSLSRRLAKSSMQREMNNERQKEEELLKQGIIKSVSRNGDQQDGPEQKEERKKVQVKESIIQQEIRLQKEREEAIKKEHDRLKPRPKSSYQSEVKQPEGDADATKRLSAPVTETLTQLQRGQDSSRSVKRKSKLALQWEERLQQK